MSFLILGSGAREYAIAKRLYRDTLQGESIYCVSNFENYGISLMGIPTYITSNSKEIVEYAIRKKVKFVIPGGESYLITDLCYKLRQNGIHFIGPSKVSAFLETDKIFARKLINESELKIYNPKFIVINSNNPNIHSLVKEYPVIKPTAVHGGKGVKIYGIDFLEINEAVEYINYYLNKKESLVLEELLEGTEFSFQSVTNGENVIHSQPIMDFKRVGEGNTGDNTGSMGCVCYRNGLLPGIDSTDVSNAGYVNEEIIKIINNYTRDLNLINESYIGFIYGSFIKTTSGIKIIEFNARLGDPEAIPFIESFGGNFRDLLVSTVEKSVEFYSQNQFRPIDRTIVYIVPKSYPQKSKREQFIDLSRVQLNDLNTFYYSNIHANYFPDSRMRFKLGGSRALAICIRDHLEIPRIINSMSGDFKYRTDIHTIETNIPNSPTTFNYADCGVDVEKANSIVSKIFEHIGSTQSVEHPRAEVISKLGDFSGLVNLKPHSGENTLVSTIDGVGTKSSFTPLLYRELRRDTQIAFSNLGRDIVNHCVNDMLVKGGNPLMFLDYIASSKLEKSVVSAIVSGMSDECIRHNCFLIGGETAEMPGIYTDGSYDIVGTMIGTVSQENIVDGDSICENSKVWGIRSDSPHTNGYSAIRKCYSENADFNYYCKTHGEFADWLTAPHRCYLPEIKQVGIQNILGMCHITGGGYQDNLARVMPKTLGLRLQREKIFTPEWRMLQKYMRLEDMEMLKTFNCGIGMVVFTKPDCVVPDEFIEIGEIFPTDNSSVQFV